VTCNRLPPSIIKRPENPWYYFKLVGCGQFRSTGTKWDREIGRASDPGYGRSRIARNAEESPVDR